MLRRSELGDAQTRVGRVAVLTQTDKIHEIAAVGIGLRRLNVVGKVSVIGNARVTVPGNDLEDAVAVLRRQREVQVRVAVVLALDVIRTRHVDDGVVWVVRIGIDGYLELRQLVREVE